MCRRGLFLFPFAAVNRTHGNKEVNLSENSHTVTGNVVLRYQDIRVGFRGKV